ncbi:hypothetical protein PGB28_02085 [Primorskyibacter aestuariivivens]|nr:hypothetical protein [Primorskyibacter aestuariivivens]MDA7427232.1 hypothetical protein [Primorskyibacter aestuariivivens]
MAAPLPRTSKITLPAPPWQSVLATALGGTWSVEHGLARIFDRLEAGR